MTKPLVIRHLESNNRLAPSCGRKWLNLQVLTHRENRVNCEACLALLQKRKSA